MKQLIVKSLEVISIAAMVLIILTGGIMGAGTGGGFFGFVIGALAGAVVSVVTFGALFLLMDIADSARRTAQLLDISNTE